MRCKPGDLAIVVRSNNGNEGKVVTCLSLATEREVYGSLLDKNSSPWWRIDIALPMTNGVIVAMCPDAYLFPILPPEQPETVTNEETAEA